MASSNEISTSATYTESYSIEEHIISKSIEGFERYSIDTNGVVYDTEQHFIIPQSVCNGYKRVGLYDIDNKRVWLYVHRLVAITFIPNP